MEIAAPLKRFFTSGLWLLLRPRTVSVRSRGFVAVSSYIAVLAAVVGLQRETTVSP